MCASESRGHGQGLLDVFRLCLGRQIFTKYT